MNEDIALLIGILTLLFVVQLVCLVIIFAVLLMVKKIWEMR